MSVVEHVVDKPEVPTTVSKVFDSDTGMYTISFQLSQDEHDAYHEWGTNIEQEIDGKIRWAKGIIKDIASKYAMECFNAKVPLDCMCENTLFQRYCAKKKAKQNSKEE